MKVQRRQLEKQSEERKKALAETISLVPTKAILHGLSPEMLTFHGILWVRVNADGFHGYICLQPAKVCYKTPRYYKSDVYMMRDCLIDLMGAGNFDTNSHPVIECYDMDRLHSANERSKNEKRWLSEKLSQRLEENGYCLLNTEEFGEIFNCTFLVKKVVADEIRNYQKRMKEYFGH